MTARPTSINRPLLAIAMTFLVASLAAAADPLIHVVEKGETLYGIARKYDISVDSLAKANTIGDPARLSVGMRLTIPGKVGDSTVETTPVQKTSPAMPATAEAEVGKTIDYVVRKGDTLYSIAKAHGVKVDDIVKSSGMVSMTIKPGQKLRIPGVPNSKVVAIGAPPTIVPAVPAATAGRIWPVPGPVSYLKGKLKGVSIATGAQTGIQAIRAGTVISAGPFRGFGQVAFVQAADGLVYVYGGVTELSVRLGDPIRRGALIGKTGAEKDSTAYFFVFKGADTIDPDTVPRD
jgi:LysM repeat protein